MADDTYAVSNAISYARKASSDGSARLLREAAKLSLMDVAREVDALPQSISGYEKGDHMPGREIGYIYGCFLQNLARQHPDAIPYKRSAYRKRRQDAR